MTHWRRMSREKQTKTNERKTNEVKKRQRKSEIFFSGLFCSVLFCSFKFKHRHPNSLRVGLGRVKNNTKHLYSQFRSNFSRTKAIRDARAMKIKKKRFVADDLLFNYHFHSSVHIELLLISILNSDDD